MAIARVFECNGWTTDQYDKLVDRMDLGGKPAPGQLVHVIWTTENGLRAVDVYESREAADKLVEEIGPLAQEFGLSLPEISEFMVHNIHL
jgi:hypothetical protein